MAVSGGQMAVTCCLYPLPFRFQGKITHRPLCYQIFQGIGVFCPVFATPERPRITTKSDEYAIYALFSVYAVPTFMSCKSRPTYLRTYRWMDYGTARLPSHGTAIRTLLYILKFAFCVCMENRAASDNTVNHEKPLCSA